MKKRVPTFEEFIGDKELDKIRKFVGNRKEKNDKNKIYLDPDTQNPTAYGDDEETATARYPKGGL